MFANGTQQVNPWRVHSCMFVRKLTRFKGDVSRIAVIVCSSFIRYAASGTQVRRFFIATFRDINGVVKKVYRCVWSFNS